MKTARIGLFAGGVADLRQRCFALALSAMSMLVVAGSGVWAADGTIYCGGRGRLVKVDPAGHVLQTAELPENADSVVIDNRRGSKPTQLRLSGIAASEKDVFVAFGRGWGQLSQSKLFRFDRELCALLQEQLHRRVEVAYAESLSLPSVRALRGIELIVGKVSEVAADAAKARLGVRALAMLSDKDGAVTQSGLFIVRGADRAQSLQDLADYRILLGPEDAVEKHAAALASMEAFRLLVPAQPAISPSCNAFQCVASLKLFDDVPAAERDTWSHPALVGNRFYVRNGLGVYCFLLE